MRLKPGRPKLEAYADRFDVPAAAGDFAVTFLGVSSLLFDDGRSAVMVDGFFSRPSLAKVLFSRISPDSERIDAALARIGFGPGTGRQLQAVVPVHTHFDHAMDAAVVAERTGALLIGGESAANLGLGQGLPAERIRVATPAKTLSCGPFELTLIESRHCPPDRFPGAITEPVVPPVRAVAYRCGEAWSLMIGHESGRTALVQGSAGFVAGALDGRRADVAYLGVGQLGLMPEDYIHAYWRHTVHAVGARRVVLTHWDDFFRPLERPLRALPFAGDDLDATMRVLTALARDQQVTLHFPRVWAREDPWS
jgi:L-ascorbate metabolism protein UlaG (beta-lactamase superfamily)